MVKKISGFTLIELMIVIAIIGVLIAIAYPSYTQYKVRTHRAEAQTEMLKIAQELQQYNNANKTFVGATLLRLYGATSFPVSNPLYNFTFAQNSPTVKDWTIVATPLRGTIQAGDGHIVLNSIGERCWSKGTDLNNGTACRPDESTNWENR